MRFVKKDRIVPEAFNSIVQATINTPGHDGYNSLGRNKKLLLQSLIDEQHSLCAYCNQKISLETSTIEHLICQSHNPNLDLNYHNLFAVCKGNDGKIPTSHCDKYRANGKQNGYFFPFILFEKCISTSWDSINPFFDIEFNSKLRLVSGKIIPREANISGFPSIKNNIQNVIDMLNLNAPILIEARKEKWQSVLDTKQKRNLDWKALFDYYVKIESTDFYEFVLIAIHKQES